MLGREGKSRGAITVEAAIVLPIFICVAISLTMLIKLIYVHAIMQHAIDEAANELSAYAYIYHISDLQEIDDSIEDNLNRNAEQAEAHSAAVVDAFDALENAYEEFDDLAKEVGKEEKPEVSFADKAGAILNQAESMLETGEQVTKRQIDSMENLYKAFEEACANPKKEAQSMAWMLTKSVYSEAKSIMAAPLVKYSVRKYLRNARAEDIDQSLKRLNVCNGFAGLDFYSSSIFEGNEDIDIVVKYKVELPLPIKLLPDIYIMQRSTARAWLNGGDGLSQEETSIWELPNKQRGMKIEELYGGNLPYDFPYIDTYDAATRTGTSIKSINLNSKTYQDPVKLKRTLKQYVEDIKGCGIISYKQENYTLAAKRLIIVIPKGSVNSSNGAVLEQIKAYAASNAIDITINEL